MGVSLTFLSRVREARVAPAGRDRQAFVAELHHGWYTRLEDMKSGDPPSVYAPVASVISLDAERGRLRENLASLRNLAQLLHSLRVASRPLSSLLPDVLEGCTPLRRAMAEILSAARSALHEDEAADGLEAFVLPLMDELETAVRAASERPLNARSRLLLEERVTRVSQELDTARGLFELFADTIAGRKMRLDVIELTRQSFSGPQSGSAWPRETLEATLAEDAPGLELLVNPRVTTSLIALGVELTADPGDPSLTPHIRISATAGGGCHIHVQREAASRGEDLQLLRRGLIAPTRACMAAAARASGAVLDFDAKQRRFSLWFAEAFPSRVAEEVG